MTNARKAGDRKVGQLVAGTLEILRGRTRLNRKM